MTTTVLESTPTCLKCGYALQGRQSHFCSRACKKRHYAASGVLHGRRITATCPQCRNDFETLAALPNQCCSPSCAKAWAFATAPTVNRECRMCGSAFPGKSLPGGKQQTFCSPRCRNKARRKRRSSQLYNHFRVVRYARVKAAFVEKVDPLTVFERDGWQCWICGKSCTRTEPMPHPDYPTVDHVHPISKGGEHSYANCRCACLNCNAKKNATVVTPAADA